MEIDPKNRPILFQYFESTADVLLAEYTRSAQQNASANLGKNRELFCRNFLEKNLPAKLNVNSGEIWDSTGHKTGQEDIVILRDDSPRLHIGSDDIFLAEGTFGVIEIKSNLDRTKLAEAGENLKKVESLKLNIGGTMSSGPIIDRPLRFVFAYEGATWETLINEITQKGWNELFDLICILNRGVLIKRGGLITWPGDQLFLQMGGKAAALGFLYYYLVSYGSSFLGRSLVLDPYFQPINNWGV